MHRSKLARFHNSSFASGLLLDLDIGCYKAFMVLPSDQLLSGTIKGRVEDMSICPFELLFTFSFLHALFAIDTDQGNNACWSPVTGGGIA